MNQPDDRYSPGAGLENSVLIDNLSDGEWSDDDKIICKKSRAIDGSNALSKSDVIVGRSQTKSTEPTSDAIDDTETNDSQVGRTDDADKASMDAQTGTVMKCELATKPTAVDDTETNDCQVRRIDDADKALMDAKTKTVMKCKLATKPIASAIDDTVTSNFQKARISNVNAEWWEDSDTESIVVKWMDMEDRNNSSCPKSKSNISILINQTPRNMVLLEYPFGKKCTVSLLRL